MTQAQFNKIQLWRDRLKQFEKSPLTAAQFCQSIGCSMSSFYKWRNSLAGQSKSARAAVPRVSSISPSPFLQVSTTANLDSQGSQQFLAPGSQTHRGQTHRSQHFLVASPWSGSGAQVAASGHCVTAFSSQKEF